MATSLDDLFPRQAAPTKAKPSALSIDDLFPPEDQAIAEAFKRPQSAGPTAAEEFNAQTEREKGMTPGEVKRGTERRARKTEEVAVDVQKAGEAELAKHLATVKSLSGEERAQYLRDNGLRMVLDDKGNPLLRMFYGIGRGAYSVTAGLEKTGAATFKAVGADYLASEFKKQALIDDAIANSRISGETTIEELRKNPTLYNAISASSDLIAGSIPEMTALATGAGGVALAATNRAGNIGQTRAENDGRSEADIWDVGAAAPWAITSAALDKFGFEAMLGRFGTTTASRLATGVGGEALTEGAQSAIEYTGGSLGTKEGFDPEEAAKQAGEGALGGLLMAGPISGASEALNAATAKKAKPAPYNPYAGTAPIEPAPPSAPTTMDSFLRVGKETGETAPEPLPVREPGTPPPDDPHEDVPLTQSDIESPLPNDIIQRGKNAAADALGGRPLKPKAVPPAANVFDRMVQITAVSESRNRERDANGNLITSPAGAKGKMQVMPGTEGDPGFGVRPMQDNSDAERTRVGRDYLAAMLRRYGNDPAKAWAAYNWGPGNLDNAIKKHGDGWLDHAPDETRKYVFKNMSQLGGDAFNSETGESLPVDVPEAFDQESTEDFVKRVLGDDFFEPTKKGPVNTKTPTAEEFDTLDEIPETYLKVESVVVKKTDNYGGGQAGTLVTLNNGEEWWLSGNAVNENSRKEGEPRIYRWEMINKKTGSGYISLGQGISRAEAIKRIPHAVEYDRKNPDSLTLLDSATGRPHVMNVTPVLDLLQNIEAGNEIAPQDQKWAVSTGLAQPTDAGFELTDEGAKRIAFELRQKEWSDGQDAPEVSQTPEADAPLQNLQGSEPTNLEGLAPSGSAMGGKKRIPAQNRRGGGYGDFLTFIADRGGVRDDEGHSLRKLRNMQQPIAGAGSLIRDNGMSIDELGELSFEMGWFPERPTTAQVLELIERANFEKVYHPEEAAQRAEEDKIAASPKEDEAQADIAALVEQWGTTPLDEEEMALAVDLVASGKDVEQATIEAIEVRAAKFMGEPFGKTKDSDYDFPFGANANEDRPQKADEVAQESDQRPAPGQEDAGQGEASSDASGSDSSPQIEYTPSGKGIRISGHTPAHIEAISKAAPKAQGIADKRGGVTYSKKYEDAIRKAVGEQNNRDKNKRDGAPARETLGRQAFEAGDSRVPPSEMSAEDKALWLKGWDRANLAAPVPEETADTPSAEPVKKDVEGTYIVSDSISDDGPETVRVINHRSGAVAIVRDDGQVIEIDKMLDAGFSVERAIAQSLGQDTTGKNVSKTNPESEKHAQIDRDFAANRAVLGNFKKGDKVEWDHTAFYTDGRGRTFTGIVDSVQSKDQGIIKVIAAGGADYAVPARHLRPSAQPAGTRVETERAANPTQPGTTKQMPNGTVKDAQTQGWNAAEAGWSIEDNPYIPTSSMSDAWRRGFRMSDKITSAAKRAATPPAQAPEVKAGERYTVNVENIGYLHKGQTYTVEPPKTPKGEYWFENVETGGRTSINRFIWQRSLAAGDITKAETPEAASPPQPVRGSDYGAKNKFVTADRAAIIRERLKKKLDGSQLNAGPDPEILALGAELAAFHIEAGARKFKDFAVKIADDLGMAMNEIRPFLRSWYNGARDLMEDSGENIDGMDDAEAVKSGLRELAGNQNDSKPVETGDLRQQLRNTFYEAFRDGKSFASITEARAYATEKTGQEFKAGTEEAKMLDEAIESGIIQAARAIAIENRDDAPQAYQRLVGLYNRQPKLGVRSSTSVEQQAYSTPVPLAYLASRLAGITQNSTVYEPTAGNGALLIDANPANVRANELNQGRANSLRSNNVAASVISEDAVTYTPPGKYDVVIANPPFGPLKGADGESIEFNPMGNWYTKEIDHAIAWKALQSMEDGGRAVLLLGGINKLTTGDKARGDAYNGKAKREFYYLLHSQYNVVDHFTVSGDLYERQGAGWPVDVIVIEGRGKSSLPLPAVKPPRQYDSWDALSEVLTNGRNTDSGSIRGQDGSPVAQGVRSTAADVGDTGVSGTSRTDRQPNVSQNDEPGAIRSGPVDEQSRSESVGGTRENVAAPAGDNGAGRTAGRAPASVETAENDKQVTYTPGSQGAEPMGTLVPVNMQNAPSEALAKITARQKNSGGTIDSYVAEKLGYSEAELYEAFGAEQIDALALAIDNIERGAGFIIGDQTGIGKGRVVAGIIRYATIEGRTPIFVTEKPNLYSDMFRDMEDIGLQKLLGRPIEAAMTNSALTVPLDEDSKRTIKSPAKAKNEQLFEKLANDGIAPHGVDVIFTTYSQMQTIKGEETARMKTLRRIAQDGILILDESHNAGGTAGGERKKKAGEALNRAEFVREIVGIAHGVFYSSATYAKRPDVMDLYAATDMSLAVDDPSKLGEAIMKGGVPMQQVVASMLARAGQYVRRERSFDGITYDTPVVEVDSKEYADACRILKLIQSFSEDFVGDAVEVLNDDLKNSAENVAFDGSVGGAGATSTNFTSVMHNVISQMLLAMKADAAAEKAIDAIKRGEKPVITVANTLEAMLNEFVELDGSKVGDEVGITFADVFRRYLERSRMVTIKKPFAAKGEKGERVRLTDEQLGPMGARAFREAMNFIGETSLDRLPGSPIDHIIAKIAEAGYQVGEITGREFGLNYRNGKAYLKARGADVRSIKGKLNAINGFNSGKIDAMILNRSGSTGLSLHASTKFKDQRKRRMIIAQAEGNIDTHMQMLGRVHRTGQVVLPSYDQLVAGVPAEKRPAAILAKKMASLNANTTASRDSALTSKETLDFMNEYGDEVIARLMAEEPEIHDMLGAPLQEEDEGYVKDGAAHRITGRIPLLPVDMQEELYDRIEQEYRSIIEQKDAAGENALEAKTLDLKARTESTEEAVAAKGGSNSPFAGAVTAEQVSVVRQGRPYTGAEVVAQVAASLGATAPEDTDIERALRKLREGTEAMRKAQETKDAIDEGRNFARDAVEKIKDVKRRDVTNVRLANNITKFRDISQVARIGAGIRIATETGNFYGIVTNVERTGSPKNPLALGSWKVRVALADATRAMTLPMSYLTTAKEVGPGEIQISPAQNTGDMPIARAFDEFSFEAREKRVIITGNLLAGFDFSSGQGTILNYTTEDGQVKQGILMRRGFSVEAAKKNKPVALTDSKVIIEWLRQAGGALTGQGKSGAVSVVVGRGDFIVTAARSKAAGGEFFLNRKLTDALGVDFYSRSSGMVAVADIDRAETAIDVLLKAGVKFQVPSNASEEEKEQARALIARYSRKFSVEGDLFEAPKQPEKTMTDRQRAELEARQKQGMARKGGQTGLGDQEGGLFASERDQGTLFHVGDIELTEDQRAEIADIIDGMKDHVESLGLADKIVLDVVNKIVDNDGKLTRAQGSYWRNVITVAAGALRFDKIPFVLNHEAIHALRDIGVFKPSEWAALVKVATSNKKLMANIRERYTDLYANFSNPEEAMIEEAVADMFAIWRQGKASQTGFVRAAFQRILDLFSAFRRLLNMTNAKDRAEAVMNDIASGEIGRRERGFGRISEMEDVAQKFSIEANPDSDLPEIGDEEQVAKFGDAVRRKMQDRMLPLMRVQARIEMLIGRQLPEWMRPYEKEELMQAKVAAQIDRLSKDMVNPLIDQMHAEGIQVAELETYLYARHAPERNERISKINPEFEEGTGSGMSDAEAASVMAQAEAEGKIPALERLANRVDEITAFALNTRVEAGLLSEEEAEAWREQYQFYVPLRGHAEFEPETGMADRPRRGAGINVRGKESKRAFGRESKATNILGYTIMQAQEAIIRAQKNEVGKALYALARANPDPEFWNTKRVTRKPYFDKTTGTVRYRNDTNIDPQDEPYTVSLKIDGQERRVTFNRENKAARQMVNAMRMVGQSDGKTLHFLAMFNRYFSAINTRYNPEFVITNMLRDMQTGAFNLSGLQIDGIVKNTTKNYPGALKAAMKGAFGKEDGDWGQWHREFVDAGGVTGWNVMEDVEEIQKRIEKRVQRKLKGGVDIRGALVATRDVVEHLNSGVENALRLAAFKAAREAGLSADQAAGLAKNVTVNFTRRGEWATFMNAMYAFYNASIQGNFRLITGIAKGGKVSTALAASAVAIGFGLDLLNGMLSDDDDDGESVYDKIGDFDKSRNLIIMMPGSNKPFIKIPLAYGLNVFFGVGRAAGEMQRGRRWEEASSALLMTIADAFNPVGGTNSFMNFVAPTWLDPAVDIERNKNFANRPIYPNENPFGPEEADNTEFWPSTTAGWRGAATFLNKISGGDEVVPGAADFHPETLRYLAGVFTGAAGSFVERTEGMAEKMVRGEPIETNEIPLVRKVVGAKPSWYDKAAYYARVNEIEQFDHYVKQYREDGLDDQADAFEEAHGDVLDLAKPAKKAKKQMRGIRKARAALEADRDAGAIDDAQYREEKTALDDDEKAIITEFNTEYLGEVAKPKRP